jgi:hypothetical protein
VQLVPLGLKALLQLSLVQRVLLDQLDPKETRDQLAHKVLTSLVRLVPMDRQVWLVQLVQKVKEVRQVLLALKAQQVLLVKQDQTV